MIIFHQLDARKGKNNEDVALLKDDDYVAKLARSRFLLSKEGEQIYPTPEQMKKTQTSGAEESKATSFFRSLTFLSTATDSAIASARSCLKAPKR
jgi:cell division protein DivIC